MTPADVTAALDSIARRPILAEIGGFRPPGDPRASRFGAGCLLAGEEVPAWQGDSMFPLLQINAADLPRPAPELGPAFAGAGSRAVLVLWHNRREVCWDNAHGDGWCVQVYDSPADLVPADAPPPEHVKPFPVRWSEGEPEAPRWEEAWEELPEEVMEAINAADDGPLNAAFYEYPHCYRTKIGGFPSDIQHRVPVDPFAFQIASEEKANWMIGDHGTSYYGRPEGPGGAWTTNAQCY